MQGIDDNKFCKYSKLGGLFRWEKAKHTILHRTRFGDFQKIETTQWSTIVVGLSNNFV